jgi:DMSO/TMAO reductase YedYZ heme-binding membrane subunit
MLQTESLFHIISAVFIFAAAGVPIYLSFKLKDKFRKLVIALAIFILFHGVYHVFGSLGYDFISSSIFEPISAMALVAFGVMYLMAVRDAMKLKRQEKLSV